MQPFYLHWNLFLLFFWSQHCLFSLKCHSLVSDLIYCCKLILWYSHTNNDICIYMPVAYLFKKHNQDPCHAKIKRGKEHVAQMNWRHRTASVSALVSGYSHPYCVSFGGIVAPINTEHTCANNKWAAVKLSGSFEETTWTSHCWHAVQELTVLRLLTEVTGEEEGLCSRSPLFKKQAVVRLSLHTEGLVASCELVKTSFCLLQLEKLFL